MRLLKYLAVYAIICMPVTSAADNSPVRVFGASEVKEIKFNHVLDAPQNEEIISNPTMIPSKYDGQELSILTPDAQQRICYDGKKCNEKNVSAWSNDLIVVNGGQYIQLKAISATAAQTERKIKYRVGNTVGEWLIRTGKGRSCYTLELGKIASGEAIKSFKELSVPHDQKCKLEERICNDGRLSGSFKFKECHVVKDEGCYTAPWGKLSERIEPGRTIIAYKDQTVPFGMSCDLEMRACKNGSFTGSYTYQSCRPEEPKSCINTIWGDVKHGETRRVYKYSERKPGQTSCEQNSKIVSCENGTMASPKGYNQKLCMDVNAKMCDSPCGQIYDGDICIAFKGCEDYQTRICKDGALSGSYTQRLPDCKSCTLPWGEMIMHAGSRVGYKNDIVAKDEECRSRVISCNNGTAKDYGYKYNRCMTAE